MNLWYRNAGPPQPRVTIRGKGPPKMPRPRKWESNADRQAAYRRRCGTQPRSAPQLGPPEFGRQLSYLEALIDEDLHEYIDLLVEQIEEARAVLRRRGEGRRAPSGTTRADPPG